MLPIVNDALAWLDRLVGDSAGTAGSRRGIGDLRAAALLLAPALTILAAFGLVPLLYAAFMSLHTYAGRERTYVGFSNFREVVSSPDFWNSVRVTTYYAAATVPASLVIALIAAFALFRMRRFRGVFRTAFYLPYVTSAVAAAMVWRALFEPRFGVLNLLLTRAGLPAQQWLLEPRGVLHIVTGGDVPADVGPSLALVCVVIFDVWHQFGFMLVVLLAGLAAIPREYDEAARMDGAGRVQAAWHVTLPLLSPVIFFLAVVGLLAAFQSFASFYALTGNGRGPLNTTESLTVHIYTSFYENGRLGYGAAVAVLLAAALAALTLTQWRLVGRRVYYEQ